MAGRKYAVAQAAELLGLPAPPQAALKRQVLEEFLRNPFLDDDVQGLALRTGALRDEVADILRELCASGLLKEAGRRSYMLDLERLAEGVSPEEQVAGAPAQAPAAAQVDLLDEELLSARWLAGGLPCGLLVLHSDGSQVLANEEVCAWLGVAEGELDAQRFDQCTGIDPLRALEGRPELRFSVRQPRPLELCLRACPLEEGMGVLVVLQDVSEIEQVMRAQVQIQEELFARLRAEVVGPLRQVQQFLDDPAAGELAAARVALEQVDGFLRDYLLSDPPARKEE